MFTQLFTTSPFRSIPECFWWVVVTCTTVGYGDHFSTTTGGQVAAAIAMVWSLCVLALPVGVIGANFAAVWEEYDSEKQDENALRRNQHEFIGPPWRRLSPSPSVASSTLP